MRSAELALRAECGCRIRALLKLTHGDGNGEVDTREEIALRIDFAELHDYIHIVVLRTADPQARARAYPATSVRASKRRIKSDVAVMLCASWVTVDSVVPYNCGVDTARISGYHKFEVGGEPEGLG
jgi:hypothetical protein